MTEIDKLPRVTLSQFKQLFKNAQQIQALLCEAKPEHRAEIEREAQKWLTASFEANGTTYSLSVEPNTESSLGADSILFKWTDSHGTGRSQRVRLTSKPSNLGLSPVWYFLCPYTLRTCRKIYLADNAVASRWAFSHTYSERNKSHLMRTFDRLTKALDNYPIQKNRKRSYRGKLTKYGERVAKWMDEEESRDLLEQWHGLFIAKKKGRPQKPRPVGRSRTGRAAFSSCPKLFYID